MALRSKLLDEKVVESAGKMLKKVRNNAYVAKKLDALIAAKKKQYNSRSKDILHFKDHTDYMDKVPKIWQRRKIVCSSSAS
jgi:hypothetical protein